MKHKGGHTEAINWGGSMLGRSQAFLGTKPTLGGFLSGPPKMIHWLTIFVPLELTRPIGWLFQSWMGGRRPCANVMKSVHKEFDAIKSLDFAFLPVTTIVYSHEFSARFRETCG